MSLLVGSVLLRPYVFIFLLIYLAVAVRDLGGRRAVLFTAWVWPVAYLAEFSSTRIGIPFGLLTAGQPLSFFGTLGIISLSGIIINNAIVLIDQIDIEREMLPLREAVVAASQKRLRPILLTSATTVLGLAPMAIAGGALWQPMAVLMMSGLAVASLLTLFFVPAGYFLLFWFDKDLPPAS